MSIGLGSSSCRTSLKDRGQTQAKELVVPILQQGNTGREADSGNIVKTVKSSPIKAVH